MEQVMNIHNRPFPQSEDALLVWVQKIAAVLGIGKDDPKVVQIEKDFSRRSREIEGVLAMRSVFYRDGDFQILVTTLGEDIAALSHRAFDAGDYLFALAVDIFADLILFENAEAAEAVFLKQVVPSLGLERLSDDEITAWCRGRDFTVIEASLGVRVTSDGRMTPAKSLLAVWREAPSDCTNFGPLGCPCDHCEHKKNCHFSKKI